MHRVLGAARLAARRAKLADLDSLLTSACERAAGQGQRNRIAPADPRCWSLATWRRYLNEARTQNHVLGPRIRRLVAEIDHLEAAISMKLAP